MSKKLSYNKLWKVLIDKGLKRKDLKEKCNVSSASLAKLSKGENITTDILLRICVYLNCDISDIVEIIDK